MTMIMPAIAVVMIVLVIVVMMLVRALAVANPLDSRIERPLFEVSYAALDPLKCGVKADVIASGSIAKVRQFAPHLLVIPGVDPADRLAAQHDLTRTVAARLEQYGVEPDARLQPAGRGLERLCQEGF